MAVITSDEVKRCNTILIDICAHGCFVPIPVLWRKIAVDIRLKIATLKINCYFTP